MKATRVVEDLADTTGFDADQAALWAEQKAMYAAYLAGDRARIDRWIHPTATIWDGVSRRIARGLVDLNAIRAARPVGDAAPVTTWLAVDEPIVTVIGDAALSRHMLLLRHEGAAREEQVLRVSAGWQRFNGEWWLIHSHEDIFAVTPLLESPSH